MRIVVRDAASLVGQLAKTNVASRVTSRPRDMRRGQSDRMASTAAAAAATWKRRAQAATAAALIATAVRSVVPVVIRVRTIVRRAIRRIGAARVTGIRPDIKMAAVACAKVKYRAIARNQGRTVRAADTATAAAAAARPRRAARAAAAAALRAITTTTSCRARRWRRRRIRITRCGVRGISCWITRLRSGRIEKHGAGSRGHGAAEVVPCVENRLVA